MNPIPVLCDQCRAAGVAGEAPFADLADLLGFTPVPRRPHVNGWDEERQRAFIAALAVTGSPRRAARAIGKAAFGAEQLRKARGGSSFAAAWDAALELSRERELAALNDGLTELAAEQVEEDGRRRSAILPAAERAALAPDPGAEPARHRRDTDEDWYSEESRQEHVAGREKVRRRLTQARRLFLCGICDDPAMRAAWEVLVGPVDWGRAERLEAQDDEPFGRPEREGCDARMPNMRTPDMILTAEAGYLAGFAGGEDAMAELKRQVAEFENDPDARDSPLPSAEGNQGEGLAE